MLFSLLLCFCTTVSSSETAGKCSFPTSWHGEWFQSGVSEPVIINATTMSNKGRCFEKRRDSLLVEDSRDRCYRCILLIQKHPNVLQYKESYCLGLQDFDSQCDLIRVDSPLFSLFRRGVAPVRCPLHGPFTFTYSKGKGECSKPLSSIDACTEDSRLLLRYQACPDVPNSESIAEELLCLGAWKELSVRYFAGILRHRPHSTDEDSYRCFVFEEGRSAGVDFLLAQSGDATCNGLTSATEGDRTLKLTRIRHSADKCHFPPWVSLHHRWRQMGAVNRTFLFNHRNTSLQVRNDSGVTRLICARRLEEEGGSVKLIAHAIQDCKSSYVCLRVTRADANVLQLRMGGSSPGEDVACDPLFFRDAPTVVLIAENSRPRPCPLLGRWRMEVDCGPRAPGGGCPQPGLHWGCEEEEEEEAENEPSMRCLAHWHDLASGTEFLVARKGAEEFCITLTRDEYGLKAMRSASGCDGDSSLMLNVTHFGSCAMGLEKSEGGGVPLPSSSSLMAVPLLALVSLR